MDDGTLLCEVYLGPCIWIIVSVNVNVNVCKASEFCTISPTIRFIQWTVLSNFWTNRAWASLWLWSELKPVWYYSSHFFIFIFYFCRHFNLIMEVFRRLSNTWRYSTKNRLEINRFHKSHGNSGRSCSIHVTKNTLSKYKHLLLLISRANSSPFKSCRLCAYLTKECNVKC